MRTSALAPRTHALFLSFLLALSTPAFALRVGQEGAGLEQLKDILPSTAGPSTRPEPAPGTEGDSLRTGLEEKKQLEVENYEELARYLESHFGSPILKIFLEGYRRMQGLYRLSQGLQAAIDAGLLKMGQLDQEGISPQKLYYALSEKIRQALGFKPPHLPRRRYFALREEIDAHPNRYRGRFGLIVLSREENMFPQDLWSDFHEEYGSRLGWEDYPRVDVPVAIYPTAALVKGTVPAVPPPNPSPIPVGSKSAHGKLTSPEELLLELKGKSLSVVIQRVLVSTGESTGQLAQAMGCSRNAVDTWSKGIRVPVKYYREKLINYCVSNHRFPRKPLRELFGLPPSETGPSSTGLEEVLERQRVRRIAIQDQIQATLRDLTHSGFTVQILDQGLVETFPALAVLAELQEGIRIDRSQNPQETGEMVEQLVLRENVARVTYYGNSVRVMWFQHVAKGFIDVDTPEPTKRNLLLLQLLSNLSRLSHEVVSQRVNLSRFASWLSELA